MSTSGPLAWMVPEEVHGLLLRLLDDLEEALAAPTGDPVVERLFPRAIEGADEEDAELRLLLASDLLLRRREAINSCREVLRAGRARRGRVRVVLRDDEPTMLLQVLNDVRLALGARVGATAVELRQLVEPDDLQAQQALETMDLLAWFQMRLLEHIDPVAARHDGADPEE